MLNFLIRSIGLGLISAIIIILAVPSLRSNIIPNQIAASVETIADLGVSFNDAVRRAAPAVVNLYNRQYIAEDHGALKTQGLGSGVIVSDKGYIITNYHVIAKADLVVVALQDGRIANAQLIGTDRRTDIAVLRIELDNLPTIPLNPSYNARVGDIVLAIGNPYNLGQTTTFGIISATGRSSISANGQNAFIQTDAAINQGNSGGALVNTQGELVAINTASFQQATELETYGISFAIPYKLANTMMEKIIADGRVIRGYIGIDGQDVNQMTSRLLGGNYVGAIVVLGMDENGPAAQAGILKNDIVVNIGGIKVAGRESIMDIVTDLRPGTSVDFEIVRNGETIIVPVKVAELPSE